jgi:hypothetical protein
LGSAILPCPYVEIRDNNFGLVTVILVFSYESWIIIWVWAQPFYIINIQNISINYMGLGAAIPQYAEIRENRTGLGSAILPCPHVEIRDNHMCLV